MRAWSSLLAPGRPGPCRTGDLSFGAPLAGFLFSGGALGGDDAVEQLGDFGDALADQVVEAAGRHDGEDGLFRLLRFFLAAKASRPSAESRMRPAASSAVARMAASSRNVFTSTVTSSDIDRPFSSSLAVARPLWR